MEKITGSLHSVRDDAKRQSACRVLATTQFPTAKGGKKVNFRGNNRVN